MAYAFTDMFVISNNSLPTKIEHTTDICEQMCISPLAALGVVFNMFLFVVNSGGNLLTIVTVYKTESLQTVPNMYVVSLAVADLQTGFAILYYMLRLIPYFNHVFDNTKYLCLLRYTFAYTYVTQSLLSMCLISIDRLLYIKYAIRYHLIGTVRNAGIAIAISWIISVIVGTVPLYDNIFSPAIGCQDNLTKGFQLYGTLVMFLLCLFCTVYCYAQITRIALKQRRVVKAAHTPPYTENTRHAHFIDRGYLKSVKLFAIVFLVFLTLWSPISVICVILQVTDNDVPTWSVYLAVTLGFINSSTNFLIYTWRNKQFRRAFLDILCPCRRQS